MKSIFSKEATTVRLRSIKITWIWSIQNSVFIFNSIHHQKFIVWNLSCFSTLQRCQIFSILLKLEYKFINTLLQSFNISQGKIGLSIFNATNTGTKLKSTNESSFPFKKHLSFNYSFKSLKCLINHSFSFKNF